MAYVAFLEVLDQPQGAEGAVSLLQQGEFQLEQAVPADVRVRIEILPISAQSRNG